MRIDRALYKVLLCAALPLSITALSGCGEGAPPYEDLPLRDALSAAPEVLADLPEDALRDIALRLEEAHDAAVEETPIASAEIPTAPALVLRADARRADEGKDASVLAVIEPAAGGFVLRSIAVSGAPQGPFEPPLPSGQPAISTASIEGAALRGRAGAILVDLARRSDAHDVVRITGAPVGVIAMDGTMYVNASWLVALSALEPAGSRALPGPLIGAPSLPRFPSLQPKSVRLNPYNLPASVAQCAADVQSVCTCAASTQCDHTRTDQSFADAQAECDWVNQDIANAEALCVLALMRIDGIRECVQASGSECATPLIGSRDDALSFVSDVSCLSALDYCLQHGEPPAVFVPDPGGSRGCNNGNGCSGDGCSGCSEDIDSCNQSCSDCNQTCSDCNQNCEDCNQNCEDCNQNRKDCDEACGKSAAYGAPVSCKVSADRRLRASAGSSAPMPLGTAFWLLAPAGYIFRRARRRS